MLFFSLRKQNGSRKNTKTVYSPKRTRPNKKDQPTNYLPQALSTLLGIFDKNTNFAVFYWFDVAARPY